MESKEEMEKQFKSYLTQIKKSMPHFSKEEQLKMITKAVNESEEIPSNQKDEVIKILSNIKL